MNNQYVVLESERLFIRQAHINDASEIADYFKRNRAFHKQFDPIRPDQFYTDSFWVDIIPIDLLKFKNDESLRLFIFHKDTPNIIIGMIHYSGFIRGVFQATYVGYSLDEHKQGNGFMFEGLSTSSDYIFNILQFHRIMANCMLNNKKSLDVLEKLNFITEGTAKDYLYINGKWEDHILTALINKNHNF